jgi:signal peptidase I
VLTLRHYLLVLALLLMVKLFCPYKLNLVVGSSMEPNLRDGQLCLVDTGAYRRSEPRRGDVVLANLDSVTCVKRVYGLPGDRFWLLRSAEGDTSGAFLLGARVPQGVRNMVTQNKRHFRLERVVVPDDCLYLVGDNLPASMDSRELGWGYQEDLIGRVLAWRSAGSYPRWTPPPPPLAEPTTTQVLAPPTSPSSLRALAAL